MEAALEIERFWCSITGYRVNLTIPHRYQVADLAD